MSASENHWQLAPVRDHASWRLLRCMSALEDLEPVSGYFRPPSAGVYPRTKKDIEEDRYHEAQSGHYYRLMIGHVKSSETKLISPVEVALRKRGESNVGCHYLGCAKTFALMGKSFADAILNMMKPQKRPQMMTTRADKARSIP